LARRGNIADNSASRTIVRWQSRSRSPMMMRVYRWRIDCTCRNRGLKTPSGGQKWGVPKDVDFRTKPKSALNLKYVAGVKTTTTVWAPDTLATSRSANSGRGRHPACARGPADNYCRPCCPRLIPDTVAIVIKPMSTNLTMERPHRKNGCTDGLPLFLGERPIKRFALGQSDADLVRCRPTW